MDKKILARIKKLLALSTSPNANEAASALRRAQELMEEHGISHDQVGMINVTEEEAPTSSGDKPPQYECNLVGQIAKAFGCRLIYAIVYPRNSWRIIGVEHRAQVAHYLTIVLLRKLRNARAEYLKTLYRCKRQTKVRRADEYCLGWCWKAVQKIMEYTGSAEEEAMIERYMQQHHPDTTKLTATNRVSDTDRSKGDLHKGIREASDLQLHGGVGGAEQGRPQVIGAGV